MARMTCAVLFAAAALTATGCRSPFEKPRGPSADEWRVGRGFHAWPAFEYAAEDDGSRTDVLWPGLSVWNGKDAVETVEFLYPLGEWHRKDGDARTAFRPLFDLETQEPTAAAPEGVWDLDVAWPFVKWRESAARDERRIFPVYWYEHTASKRSEHFWPVYGHRESGPRTDHWIAAPLVHWASSSETDLAEWDVVWPLLHYGDTDTESSWRVLPLLWHDASKHSQDHHTVVFPFWWDLRDGDSQFSMLFPFYGEQRTGDDASLVSIGGPLYVGQRNGDETSTGVLFPFFDVTTSPSAWSWRAAPVLWFGAEGEAKSHSAVWPLFAAWQGRSEDGLSILPPLFWHVRDGSETDVWAPAPFVHFTRAPDHGTTTVFPFSHEWTQDRSEGWLLWFLSTWESNEKEGTSDFRILWRLVESTDGPHRSTLVVNPFWRRETNDRGDDYWSVLFGMLARKEESGEVTWRVLWVF